MDQDFPPSFPNQKTNGMAITSLVLGICTFFTCCLTGLPAVIFGILALLKIGKNPGMKGKGMAIAGLILGGLAILGTPIVASLAIPAFHGGMEGAKQAIQINECAQVGRMLTEYANKNKGKYPDSLEVLLSDSGQSNPNLEKMLYQEGTREFKWILTPGLTTESPSETVLLRAKEKSGVGQKLGHVIYTLDGTTKIDRDNR